MEGIYMWPPTDSGSWADWVAGIGTLIAVVVALAQIAIGRSSERNVRRSAQASGISAWLDHQGPWENEETGESGDASFDLHIANYSNGVIYDVSILPKADESYHWRFRAVTPSEWKRSIGEARVNSEGPSEVDIAFRDASGHCWHRTVSGVLKHKRSGWLKRRTAARPDYRSGLVRVQPN